MAKFPDWGVGMDGSANNFALGIPDITVKGSATTRSATTTLSDDPALSSISLTTGTWHVKLWLIWATDTSTTPDIKTRWVHTGTWNNPNRLCLAPAPSNTATANAVTVLRMSPVAAGTDSVYGSANNALQSIALEESYTVVVTADGLLSLQWAQNTSDASNTTVGAGSAFEVRRIA